MILKACEQHRIPLFVMDDIMEDFQLLYQVAVTACRTKIETALAEASIEDDAIASALIHLKEGPHSQRASNSASTACLPPKTLWVRGEFLRLKGLPIGIL